MTDKTESEWIESTGTVPAGVGPDTRIEVEYRGGPRVIWGVPRLFARPLNSNPALWFLDGHDLDVIRFRFLDAPASAAAQAGGAE